MKNIIAVEAKNYKPPLMINKTYYPISISSGQTSFSIKNSGTAAAPCRLSFSPINDVMSLSIKGLSEETIVMTNLTHGSNVVIDGIEKTVLIDGVSAFSHFDGWEFPKLQPGNNIIELSAAEQMSFIEIEFQPRFI